jgi:hypothetical protein
MRPSADWTSGSARRRGGLTTSRRGRGRPGLCWWSLMTCLCTSAATRPRRGRAWLPPGTRSPGFLTSRPFTTPRSWRARMATFLSRLAAWLAGPLATWRVGPASRARRLRSMPSPVDRLAVRLDRQGGRAGRGRVDGRHSAPLYSRLRAGGFRRADPDDLRPGRQAISLMIRSLSASLTAITATRT